MKPNDLAIARTVTLQLEGQVDISSSGVKCRPVLAFIKA
jgi:hypothetical protein